MCPLVANVRRYIRSTSENTLTSPNAWILSAISRYSKMCIRALDDGRWPPARRATLFANDISADRERTATLFRNCMVARSYILKTYSFASFSFVKFEHIGKSVRGRSICALCRKIGAGGERCVCPCRKIGERHLPDYISNIKRTRNFSRCTAVCSGWDSERRCVRCVTNNNKKKFRVITFS